MGLISYVLAERRITEIRDFWLDRLHRYEYISCLVYLPIFKFREVWKCQRQGVSPRSVW